MNSLYKHIIGIFYFTMFCISANAQSTYTLQQALQVAKQNNPILKTEQYSIGIAQSDIVTAKLRSNFILNNQTIQLMQASQFAENTNWHNPENRQVLWQLTKTFAVAGQRRHQIDVAYKNVALSENNYLEIQRNLFFDVAVKWLEIWSAQKELDILNTAKGNTDSLLIINNLRYKNKAITQTDLFRTQVLSNQYAIQYKTAQQQLYNKRHELQFMLGVQDSVRIDTTDVFLIGFTEDVQSMYSQSLKSRSDILSTQSLIDASSSNIKLQKALAYPQPELGFIWNPQNTVPYFGIYANIDLPFFNRNQGEIKKSYLIKDQAEQQLYTLEQQLQTEITTAFATYHLQQQNVESYQTILQQSQTILNNVKYAYLKSGTTIIDFLEAQRSWLETQQQYYEALQQYHQSYIQLLYITGLINQFAQ